MIKFLFHFCILIYSVNSFSYNSESEAKKSHLEDIFIWKMSDELKLTAQEEKKFTEINKALNKKKLEINKKIQESIQNLKENDSDQALKKHRRLLQDYNDISMTEFDSIKKLLGSRKFINYLKIKSELTYKVKSMLIGEKNADKEDKKIQLLPPPKVIIDSK